jgi:light-regulated signal transduction histidine kinase (bacteriophytochrome)
VPTDKLDLLSCDSEPIHIPGLIQSYGCLLAADPDSGRILQVSSNVEQIIGLAPSKAYAMTLTEVLGKNLFDDIIESKSREDQRCLNYIRIPERTGHFYSAASSIYNDALIVELEPFLEDDTAQSAKDMSFCSPEMTDLQAFLSGVAAGVRRITEYDRVMIYRFDEFWNGEVIAEAKEQKLHSWLGHHYPASDIPTQARKIFTQNWVRMIADVGYHACEIVPQIDPRTARPLDLSRSVLRSVSPIHIEYLKNMGVGASLTISLICNGRLWGLIACHNTEPKIVSVALRSLCSLVGKIASYRISRIEQAGLAAAETRIRTIMDSLEAQVAQAPTFESAVSSILKDIQKLVTADGAVVVAADDIHSRGAVPENADIVRLCHWLKGLQADVFATSKLSAEFERGKEFCDVASGILSIRFGEGYIIWFRQEVVKEVVWAGDPNKSTHADGDGRLHPRHSFQAWKETMKGTATSWEHHFVVAAGVLRDLLQQSRKTGSAATPELTADADSFSHELSQSMRVSASDVCALEEVAGQAAFESSTWEETLEEVINATEKH